MFETNFTFKLHSELCEIDFQKWIDTKINWIQQKKNRTRFAYYNEQL